MSDKIVYRKFVMVAFGWFEPVGQSVTVVSRTKGSVHLSNGSRMTNKLFEETYGVGLGPKEMDRVKKLVAIISRNPILPMSVAKGLDTREVDVLYGLVERIRALEEQFAKHISTIWR